MWLYVYSSRLFMCVGTYLVEVTLPLPLLLITKYCYAYKIQEGETSEAFNTFGEEEKHMLEKGIT